MILRLFIFHRHLILYLFLFVLIFSFSLIFSDNQVYWIDNYAGSGFLGYVNSNTTTPASLASIGTPVDVWGDSLGNIYFVDYYGNRISKISATTKILSTIIGNIPLSLDNFKFPYLIYFRSWDFSIVCKQSSRDQFFCKFTKFDLGRFKWKSFYL